MTNCQRWSERRSAWRHTSEGGFDPLRYTVEPVGHTTARGYVIRHHYAASFPAARLAYGLRQRGELVGVAVLSVPVRAEVLTGVFPQLAPYSETLELGRFVLAEDVPANGESWFLGRCWELAAADGLRGVVSFSDPQPRAGRAGEIIMPGHVGTIYQATNAAYLGRGRARRLLMFPDGRTLNDRTVAKIKAGDRGSAAAERELVGYGARPRREGEAPDRWLIGAVLQAGIAQVAHRGNHRYAFALGTPAERRALRRDLAASQPYPKTVDAT